MPPLDEITAEMQADALAKYEAEPPTEYHVPVTRTESSTHILTVRAKTPHEAVKSALEEAGDIDFSSSCDAEYSADQAFPVKTGSK